MNLPIIRSMSDARLHRARARCAYREQQARRRGRNPAIVLRLRRALQAIQGEAVARMSRKIDSPIFDLAGSFRLANEAAQKALRCPS